MRPLPMNDTIQLSGLARQLVLHELLDEKAAQQAQSQAQRNKLSLVTYLVQSKLGKVRISRSFLPKLTR